MHLCDTVCVVQVCCFERYFNVCDCGVFVCVSVCVSVCVCVFVIVVCLCV